MLNFFKSSKTNTDIEADRMLNTDECTPLYEREVQDEDTQLPTTTIAITTNDSLQGHGFFLFVMPTFIKQKDTFDLVPAIELCGPKWIVSDDDNRTSYTAAEIISLAMTQMKELQRQVEVLGLAPILLQNGFLVDYEAVDFTDHSAIIYLAFYSTKLSDDVRDGILVKKKPQESSEISLQVNNQSRHPEIQDKSPLLLVLRLLIHLLVCTNKENVAQFLIICKKYQTIEPPSEIDFNITLLAMLDMLECEDMDWDYNDVVVPRCSLLETPLDTLCYQLAETLVKYIQDQVIFSSKPATWQLTLVPSSYLTKRLQQILANLNKMLTEKICISSIVLQKSFSVVRPIKSAATMIFLIIFFPLIFIYFGIRNLCMGYSTVRITKLLVYIIIMFLHYISVVNLILYYAYDLRNITDHPIQLYMTIVLSIYTGLIYGLILADGNFDSPIYSVTPFQTILDYAEVRTLNVWSKPLQYCLAKEPKQLQNFVLFAREEVNNTFHQKLFGRKVHRHWFIFVYMLYEDIKYILCNIRSNMPKILLLLLIFVIYMSSMIMSILLLKTETMSNNTTTNQSSDITVCFRNCSLLHYADTGRIIGRIAYAVHHLNFMFYLSASIYFFLQSYKSLRHIMASVNEFDNINEKAQYFFDITNPSSLQFIVASMRHELQRVKGSRAPLITLHYGLMMSICLIVTAVVFYFILYHSVTNQAVIFCMYHAIIFAICLIITILQVLFMNRIITDELPRLLHTKKRDLEELIAQHKTSKSICNLQTEELTLSRNSLADTFADLEFTRDTDTIKIFNYITIDTSLFIKIFGLILTNLAAWIFSVLKSL